MKFNQLLSLIILCICSFIMILVEFSPIGLLSNISNSIGVSKSIIGFSISIYAILGASSSIIFSLFLDSGFRRKVFILIFIVLTICNLSIYIFSKNIYLFIFFRSLSAITHGIFWAIIADFSMKIVEEKYKSMASSMIFSSIPLATIIGIPIINFIGNNFSWNIPFLLLSIVSLICLLLIIIYLPETPQREHKKRNNFSSFKKNKSSWILIIITGLIAISHFCSYTYIEPYIRSLDLFSNSNLLLILTLFGLSGLLGSIITTKFMDQYINRLVEFSIIIITTVLLLIFFSSSHISISIFSIYIFLWGVSISVLFTSLQTWVIWVSKKDSALMAAFNSAALNYSIGIGAIIGTITISTYHLVTTYLISSIVSIFGFLILKVNNFKDI